MWSRHILGGVESRKRRGRQGCDRTYVRIDISKPAFKCTFGGSLPDAVPDWLVRMTDEKMMDTLTKDIPVSRTVPPLELGHDRHERMKWPVSRFNVVCDVVWGRKRHRVAQADRVGRWPRHRSLTESEERCQLLRALGSKLDIVSFTQRCSLIPTHLVHELGMGDLSDGDGPLSE